MTYRYATTIAVQQARVRGVCTLAQVKTIKPPSSMAVSVKRWIGSLSQTDTDLRNALAALQAGNAAKAQLLATEGANLNTRDNADARSLGLSSCAANPQPGTN